MKKAYKIILICVSILILLSAGAILGIPVLRDWQITRQAQDILSEMTTEEKVSQMLVLSFRNTLDEKGEQVGVTQITPEISRAITKYDFGGLILFAENCQGTEQTARELYDMKSAAGNSRLGIPMLLAIDQEGGIVTRLMTGTSMPGNMALTATGDASYVTQSANIIGSELKALGFQVDFAPVADVNSNPANPVIGVRSFSDDVNTASNYVNLFIKGLQEEGIATALKHFPGHGDTATDSHTGLPCVEKSYEEIKEQELVPFANAADLTDMIMTAHIQYPQIETETYTSVSDGSTVHLPATLSRTIIHDILREDMGFDGVVVTDSLMMDAIATHFDPMDTARLAICADVDLLLMPVLVETAEDYEELDAYIAGIAAMVTDGTIPMEEIDNSVLRILKLKLKKGLFDEASRSAEEAVADAKAVVGSAEHHAQEWEMAKRAVTLLKNDDAIPTQVPENANVLCLVPYESEINSAQYAIDRLKADGKWPDSAHGEIVVYKDLTVADIEKKLSDATVVIFGAESKTLDSMNPKCEAGWQAKFGTALIARAHELGKKVTFISFLLPYDAAVYADADAILCVYNYMGMPELPTEYNGETGRYGACIPAGFYAALGGCEMTGKLPVNVYGLDGNFEYTQTVLFPRGYCLQNTQGHP